MLPDHFSQQIKTVVSIPHDPLDHSYPKPKPKTLGQHYIKDVKTAGKVTGAGFAAAVAGTLLAVASIACALFNGFLWLAGTIGQASSSWKQDKAHKFKAFNKDILFSLATASSGAVAGAVGAAGLVATVFGGTSLYRSVKAHSEREEKRAAIALISEHEQLNAKLSNAELISGKGGNLAVSEDLFIRAPIDGEIIPGNEEIALTARPEGDYHPRPLMKGSIGGVSTELHAYGYNSAKRNMDANAVVPTSKQGPNLTNCYVVKVENGGPEIIRCGVINTAHKASQFEKVLDMIVNPRGQNKPLRVVSNQLNAPEVEERGKKKLISPQHRHLADINHKRKNEIEIAHINTPANRFYHFTTQFESGKFDDSKLGRFLSMITGWFGKQIAAQFFFGERYSSQQNLEGLGTYLKWVKEDTEEIVPLNREQREHANRVQYLRGKVENTVILIGGCEDRARALEAEIKRTDYPPSKSLLETQLSRIKEQRKEFKQELRQQREKLRIAVEQQYRDFSQMEKAVQEQLEKAPIDKDSTKLTEAYYKLKLMRTLLGSQLGIAPVSRGQEHLIIAMLDYQLGAVEENNCKSGLDRTGARASVSMAMRQALASGTSMKEMMDMIMHWDMTTKEMNQFTAHRGSNYLQKVLDDQHSFEGFVSTKDRMRQVAKFRENVLHNLLKFGLPITQISTGLRGMKWNTGMQQNLLPLNFFPPSVKKGNTAISLVKYDASTGEPRQFTKDGASLFLGWSKYRGA